MLLAVLVLMTVLSHAQPRGWVSTGDACLKKCRAALRSVVAPLPAHLPALTNGGGGPHPSPPQPPQVAPHEETRQRNPGGQGELGRRSGGLVIMNVYHKSGMFLAPRLMNVLYTAGLVRHPPKGH